MLVFAALLASSGTSHAATQEPCDIYAAGGTPCVAAHSTTRALYAAYDGPLYQVQRSSDDTTLNIGVLGAGGYADAAAQDSFCSGTTCVITVIYDQSGRGNNLTQAPAGTQSGGPDTLANATAAPTTLNGHEAYGVYVAPGTGYRDDTTSGIATGDEPEGEYAVLDGTHYNAGCCFDYGNAETGNDDTGDGHMEAIYFGDNIHWSYGAGSGPWIEADLENGLYAGATKNYDADNQSVNDRYLTAMVKGTANQWSIRGGSAQSGALSTFYSGVRPAGYNPMHKEGAILLGIGGDNSKSSTGTFYEGVMTSGYPSDATENAVQANITSVGYGAPSPGADLLTPGSRITLQATTACCTTDYLRHDDTDTKVVISPVSATSSATDQADATWIVHAGLADSTCVSFESANDPSQYLRHDHFELYIAPNDGTTLFAQDATFCPQTGHNGQGYSFHSDNYPTKYLRHYDYTLYIASNGGTNAWDSATLWTDDTSWLISQPWT